MSQEIFHLLVGSESGGLECRTQSFGQQESRQESEQVRERSASDSEDNTLVAGGGKAGEEGGEGARCRAGGGADGTEENQIRPFPQGARSSLERLHTGMSAPT